MPMPRKTDNQAGATGLECQSPTVGCATEADTVFCMTDTTGNNDCYA